MFKFLLLALLCHLGQAEERATSISTAELLDEESNELEFNSRIIGGREARGQYQFVARLIINYGRSNSLCSGTVLSDRIILTAAHCVYNGGRKPFYIWAQVGGANYLFFQDEMYPHPGYNDQFSYDIAILKMDRTNEPMSNYGQPPVLGNAQVIELPRTPATVIGWGKTSDAGSVSPTLQYANVNTISNQVCRRFYGSIITPATICTLDNGKGICGGDSGGPLLVNQGGKSYVVGVNAFGSTVCQSYSPSGYTFVPAYLSWLQTVMN